MSQPRPAKRARVGTFDMTNLVGTLTDAVNEGDDNLKRALEQTIFANGPMSSVQYQARLGEPEVESELMRILESPSTEDAHLRDLLQATLERHQYACKSRVKHPRCFQCDSCLSLQHGGVVYKCAVCPQFVLCENCEQKGCHPHPMLHITGTTKVPRFVSATVPDPTNLHCPGVQAVHPETVCDSCQCTPIWGPRFKCCICDSFELCSRCILQAQPSHDRTHAMLKIPTPNMAPDSFAIELED